MRAPIRLLRRAVAAHGYLYGLRNRVSQCLAILLIALSKLSCEQRALSHSSSCRDNYSTSGTQFLTLLAVIGLRVDGIMATIKTICGRVDGVVYINNLRVLYCM